MSRYQKVGVAVLIFALVANVAAAQSVTPTSQRDPLWNGAVIGFAAGVGSAAALDAVFCDNGFGGCDTPWAAYLTLGAIGAAAGAGIDFLIGRKSSGQTTVRIAPLVGPTRRGVYMSLRLPQARQPRT